MLRKPYLLPTLSLLSLLMLVSCRSGSGPRPDDPAPPSPSTTDPPTAVADAGGSSGSTAELLGPSPSPDIAGLPEGPLEAEATAGAGPPLPPAPATVTPLRSGAFEPARDGSPVRRASAVSEPTNTAVVEDPDCGVKLNRLLFTRGVLHREPLAPTDTFEADGRPVYAFMDVQNPEGPELDLIIRWEHPASGFAHEQTMEAGVGHRWRTWVRNRIPADRSGTWTVKVFAYGDCLLAERSFLATVD